MRPEPTFDPALAQRLPLPLAQLYRRGGNAQTPPGRRPGAPHPPPGAPQRPAPRPARAHGARGVVRVSELLERLVRYRNHLPGHGALGMHGSDFYDRLGRALLGGVAELLGRLDVLAGRRLLYLAEVRRLPSGRWLGDRYELR